MFWLYLISLLPLVLILKSNADFTWKAAYFFINWIGVSVSVFISSYFGLDLAELGTFAETSYAAIAFNLALAWSLWVSLATYRALSFIGLRTRSSQVRESPLLRAEHRAFVVFLCITAAIALSALGASPPVLQGIPVSEFLASLNALQRFAFISLAIAALPLSRRMKDAHRAGKLGAKATAMICLAPALLWIMAGEKLGYLLFILFLVALPWTDRRLRARHLRMGVALSVVAIVALTLLQYALTTEDPLLQLAARGAMQGQLWYHFYTHPVAAMPFGQGLEIIGGADSVSTIRRMMAIAMPTELFLDYETASMTGSHFPALLYAFGWALLPLTVTVFGVLFGISTTLLRLAAQTSSPIVSYLIVACFVFPGIEVWVVGNTSRLIDAPMTFTLFFVLLVPLLAMHLRLAPRRRLQGRHTAAPRTDLPVLPDVKGRPL